MLVLLSEYKYVLGCEYNRYQVVRALQVNLTTLASKGTLEAAAFNILVDCLGSATALTKNQGQKPKRPRAFLNPTQCEVNIFIGVKLVS